MVGGGSGEGLCTVGEWGEGEEEGEEGVQSVD